MALSYLTNFLNKSTASLEASGTIVSRATGFVFEKAYNEMYIYDICSKVRKK